MHKRSHHLSATGAEDAHISQESAGSAALRIDALDRRILQLMQNDAARTFSEIARAIGISQGQCWRRVERLRQAGVIQKTVAQLNRYKMGLQVEAFVQVAITTSDKLTQQAFCESMRAIPEVVECYVISGEYNFLLRIMTRDLASYGQVLQNQILSQPSIAKVSTAISTSRCKDSRELPVHAREVDMYPAEAAE